MFQSQLAAFGFAERHQYTGRADTIYEGLTAWESIPNDILSDFKDFIAGSGVDSEEKSERERLIRGRARYLSEYANKYSGVVLRPRNEIGHGAEGIVYRHKNAVIKDRKIDEKCHAINGHNHEESIDRSMVCGMIVNGDPRFEQLLAADYDSCRIVCEYLKGHRSLLSRNEASQNNSSFFKLKEEMARLGLAGEDHYQSNGKYYNFIQAKRGLVAIDLCIV